MTSNSSTATQRRRRGLRRGVHTRGGRPRRGGHCHLHCQSTTAGYAQMTFVGNKIIWQQDIRCKIEVANFFTALPPPEDHGMDTTGSGEQSQRFFTHSKSCTTLNSQFPRSPTPEGASLPSGGTPTSWMPSWITSRTPSCAWSHRLWISLLVAIVFCVIAMIFQEHANDNGFLSLF